MRLFYLFIFSRNDMTPYIYIGINTTTRWNFIHKISEHGVMGIINAVGKQLGISPDDILGLSRKKPIVEARCIAIALVLKSDRNLTLEYVGTLFNRHHSTIIYNRDLYEQLMAMDRKFIAKVRKVLQII